MSPEEVLTEAKRLFALGDFKGADRVLGVIWGDARSERPTEVLELIVAIRLQEGQFRDAENFVKAAIQREPNNARWHVGLGEVYMLAGHPSHAMTSFAQALKLNPEFPAADELYAKAAIAAKKPAEAEAAARRMLKVSVSSHAYDTLSVALREQGKHKEALAAAEDALKYDATSVGALHSKGAALLRLNRHKEALDIFDHLHSTGTRAPKIALHRAEALTALGRQGEAVDVLADASRTWSQNEALAAAVAAARRKLRPN